MPRGRNLAITVLMLLLIAGSAAAFVRAQTLKLERAAVRPVQVEGAVASGCDCPIEEIEFKLALREPASVDVAVVDSSDAVVAGLASGLEGAKGRFALTWDGRRDDGTPASVGSYRLRATLTDSDRVVTFPQMFEVVTPAPSG